MEGCKPGTPEDSRHLVRTLACVLQKLVDLNRKLDTPAPHEITKFHASCLPTINVSEYLERINKYASCSTECLVLALIYIDRLIQQSNFALTSLNIHRVIITSIMLAAKFFDDQYFNNSYYAKVGGIPCKEINNLEVEFLFLINFSLHVTEEVYVRYYSELINHATNSACPCCCAGVQQYQQPIARVPSPIYTQYNSAVGGPISPVVQPPTPPPYQVQAHVQQEQCSSLGGGQGVGGGMTAGSTEQFTSYFSYESSSSSATAIDNPQAAHSHHHLLQQQAQVQMQHQLQQQQQRLVYAAPSSSGPVMERKFFPAEVSTPTSVSTATTTTCLYNSGWERAPGPAPMHYAAVGHGGSSGETAVMMAGPPPTTSSSCSSDARAMKHVVHESHLQYPYHHYHHHAAHYHVPAVPQSHRALSASAASRAASLYAQYPYLQVLMHT